MNSEPLTSRSGDPESRFLIDLAAGRSPSNVKLLTAELLGLTQRHGLLGELAHSPDKMLRDFAVPRYLQRVRRERIMKAALQRVLITLSERKVPVAVLKGPYVALSYRNPSLRSYTDLDLLVRREDLNRALEIIETDPAVGGIPPKRPRADKRDILFREPSGDSFNLDLHWDLFSYTQLLGCAAGATDWAWDKAVHEPDHELGPLWHLPREAQLAFLSTHAILDHRFRLILFRDIAELARTDVDWHRLVEFCRAWQLRSWTYLALQIAHDVSGAPIPTSILEDLRPSNAVMWSVEKLLERTDLVRFDGHRPHPLNLAIVLLHDSARGRARLAARAPVAFPSWMRRVTTGGRQRGRRRTEVRPSRVLHLLPVDLARGAQTYAKALRDALDSSEVEHRTATIFRSDAGALDADVDIGVAHGLGSRLGFSPRAMLRLRTHLKSWRPEVLVAHGGEALKYAAFATGPSTKLAYYKIGTAQDLLRNPIRRTFHRIMVRRAALVAGVSNEMVDEAQNLLGAQEERTVYIPNGRDPSLFWNIASPRGLAPVRFVFVGHLTRTKRPEVFIDVIATLRARGVEARGIVIGDGPLLEMLQRSAPSAIEFLGRRADVPTLLSECDVFLFPSLVEGEGMPGVLIEAGLSGLPVVSTDVPGARTVIDDGVTGLVVAVDEIGDFIDAAEHLALRPDLRVAMGAAARARCLERFTLQTSINLWHDHLAILLEASKR